MSAVHSSDVTRALQQMRSDVQRQVRRELMSRPLAAPAADASARRPEDPVDEVIFGSPGRCDISSAIVATNVVRRVPPVPPTE